MPLKQKLLLWVLTSSLSIYLFSTGYIVTANRESMLQDAYQRVALGARASASEVELYFNNYLSLVRGLAKSFELYDSYTDNTWQSRYLDVLRSVYRDRYELVALWDSWEYTATRPGWVRPYGRMVRQIWLDSQDQLRDTTMELSMRGDPEPYASFKRDNIASIWTPYVDTTSDNQYRGKPMTTIAAPIQHRGRFVGMVACDLTLELLQGLIRGIKPYDEAEVFLISDAGVIASHPRDSMLMRDFRELFPRLEDSVGAYIQLGKEQTFRHIDDNGHRRYVCMVPVELPGTNSHWSMGVSVPLRVITDTADQRVLLSVVAGVLSVVLMLFLLTSIAGSITRPIRSITERLKDLSEGKIPDKTPILVSSGDELETMAQAANGLTQSLHQRCILAEFIAADKLDTHIALLSEQDALGLALVKMQNSLREARKQEQERQRVNEIRRRDNQGIEDVNHTLRTSNATIDMLCEAVLRQLVMYINAEQGALYLAVPPQEGEVPRYRMMTSYAGGRKRHLGTEVELGVGLVGACALERSPITVTDLPPDYPHIPTGVGDAPPRSLALIPLEHAGHVLGVLEFASFRVLEPEVVDFLSRLAPMVASAIFSVQVNTTTRELLEQSQQQTEEMRAQEEELRQQVEELVVLQEEASRRKVELEEYVTSLQRALNYVEYTPTGRITSIGAGYLGLIGRTQEQMTGAYFADNLSVEGWGSEEFELFWAQIIEGKSRMLTVTLQAAGRQIKLTEIYIPVSDKNGKVSKVVKLSHP